MKAEKITKKTLKEVVIIIIYTLIFSSVMGVFHVFGSKTDWLSQHSVIPDYFRQLFYQTGSFLPNFSFHIGAGQNIYNLSYYGLLSPIFLLSYLMPHVKMIDFTLYASLALYIFLGVIVYFFFKRHINHKKAFILALIFISLPPLTFHFHRHIMFVWYLPFLILAFMGIEDYFNKGSSLNLILGLFLVIMTNYYYGFASLISTFLYGTYYVFKIKNLSFKSFLIEEVKLGLKFILTVLMSFVILLPSFLVIAGSNRTLVSTTPFYKLFIPDLSEVLYRDYTTGLTLIFLITALVLIIKKKSKSELFLGLVLLGIGVFPFINYFLNGFLYIRGKVFIPFIPLFFIGLIEVLRKAYLKDLSFKEEKIIFISSLILIGLMIFGNHKGFIGLAVFELLLLVLIKKKSKEKEKHVLVYTLVLTFSLSIAYSFSEKFVSFEEYQEVKNDDLKNLFNDIKDDSYFRTDYLTDELINVNRIYHHKHFTTGIYSSNYSDLYNDFYINKIGNNVIDRNRFFTVGANNPLFNNFMGVKYLVSDQELNHYQKLSENKKAALYYNKDALPMLYFSSNLGSYEVYDKLAYPYNLDYLKQHTIVEGGKETYEESLEVYQVNLKDRYKFDFQKETILTHELKNDTQGKTLILSFKLNDVKDMDKLDKVIEINGLKNCLTQTSHFYYYGNTTFNYVFAGLKKGDILKINFSKGLYDISDVKTYLIDSKFPNYQSVSDLKFDLKGSMISASLANKEAGYLVTSIPYQKGFKAFVDGKEVEVEIVNTSFVGFKVPEGNHNLKLVYEAPGFNVSIKVMIFGFYLSITYLSYEILRRRAEKFLNKNKA